ncbi:short-chain dehydrogenase/reductase [Mycobacterium tuberculosis]|nr:short chain dehydrogenase [Mycobacterium tuberculosis EAI5/NITR206]CNL30595.1 short-chain dehydrogenase/reductase [Mycobacterium tuberculosis]
MLDGIEAGKEDVLADEMSRQVRASLNVPARERIARLMGN